MNRLSFLRALGATLAAVPLGPMENMKLIHDSDGYPRIVKAWA